MLGAALVCFGFAGLCALNALLPREMWGLFRSWRFRHPEAVEPSGLVLWWYRVSGVIGAVLFVSAGITSLVRESPGEASARREREQEQCRASMDELQTAWTEEGLDGVERRAEDLGLTIDASDGSGGTVSVNVYDGDRLLGFVPSGRLTSHCLGGDR